MWHLKDVVCYQCATEDLGMDQIHASRLGSFGVPILYGVVCYCITLYFLISNYKCNIVHLIIYDIVNIVYSLRVCSDTFLAVRHKNVCGCTSVVPVYNFVLYNNVHCMALYNIRVERDIKILNCKLLLYLRVAWWSKGNLKVHPGTPPGGADSVVNLHITWISSFSKSTVIFFSYGNLSSNRFQWNWTPQKANVVYS